MLSPLEVNCIVFGTGLVLGLLIHLDRARLVARWRGAFSDVHGLWHCYWGTHDQACDGCGVCHRCQMPIVSDAELARRAQDPELAILRDALRRQAATQEHEPRRYS
jgi:hypothetical protein